jgi:hypothetical protein
MFLLSGKKYLFTSQFMRRLSALNMAAAQVSTGI